MQTTFDHFTKSSWTGQNTRYGVVSFIYKSSSPVLQEYAFYFWNKSTYYAQIGVISDSKHLLLGHCGTEEKNICLLLYSAVSN